VPLRQWQVRVLTPVVVLADVASPFMLGQVNFPYPVADAVFDDVPSPCTLDNTGRVRDLILDSLCLRVRFKRCSGLNDRQPEWSAVRLRHRRIDLEVIGHSTMLHPSLAARATRNFCFDLILWV
jgi:hypothetical protein